MKIIRYSKSYNLRIDAYRSAYRKFRYWITLLYIILLFQIWIPTTLPEKFILTFEEIYRPLTDFLAYYRNNLVQNDSDLEKPFNQLLNIKFKYKVYTYLKYPKNEDSLYAEQILSVLDSLNYYELLSKEDCSKFYLLIKRKIPEFIASIQNIYKQRSDSLTNSIGINQSEQNKLLKSSIRDFQWIIDKDIADLIDEHLVTQIRNSIGKKFGDYFNDDIIHYTVLENKLQTTKEYLSKNIVKTPYLDLPLSNKPTLIIVLISSVLLYLYTGIIYKYYSTIRIKIDSKRISAFIKVPSTRNILKTLGKNVPENISNKIAFIFFNFIPIVIIAIYIWSLFGLTLLTLVIISVTFISRFGLFYWLNKLK